MSTILDTIRTRYKLDPASDVALKWSIGKLEVKNNSGDIVAVANTASIDFDNEVVLPDGAERKPNGEPVYFSTTKAILWCHDTHLPPIGTYRNARLSDGKWVATFSRSKATQFATDISNLIDEGSVNGTSIGFIRIDGGRPTEPEIAKYGMAEYITRKWRWLELSVTPFPCNPDAVIVQRSKAVPEEFREKVCKAYYGHTITRDTVAALGVTLPRASAAAKGRTLVVVE